MKGTKIVLQPSATYTTSTNGHVTTYTTDEYGRLETIRFDITGTRKGARTASPYDTDSIGKLGIGTDIGFHIVGDQFNGNNYYPNLVPGNGKLNGSSGGYYKLESAWRREFDNSKRITDVEVKLVYTDPISVLKDINDKQRVGLLRPVSFEISFDLNSTLFTIKFDNNDLKMSKGQSDVIDKILLLASR